MTDRARSRPWNKGEDDLLKQGVERYGAQDNWIAVAELVPNRTNKACRKRWLHSLSPSLKKTAWTAAEDQELLRLYEIHGTKWSAIARNIRGRTDDACSKRYREALDPNLKKDDWTAAEDSHLEEVYARIGGKWRDVGQELQRSGLGCRNRLRLLERRKIQQAALMAAAANEESQELERPPHPLESSATQPDWPYYPPEAYPGFSDCGNHCFREPTPGVATALPPQVAPFHPSSSSLSAHLSDPPPIPPSLPPESSTDGLEAWYDFGSAHPSSESPISPDNDISHDLHDNSMMLDDFLSDRIHHERHASSHDLHRTAHYNISNRTSILAQDSPNFTPELAHIVLSTPLMSDFIPQQGNANSSCTSPLDPLPTFSHNSPSDNPFNGPRLDLHGFEDISSTTSSPFGGLASLSPTSSPNSTFTIELPRNEQPLPSLLFSSNAHLPPQPPARQRFSVAQRPHRPIGESRLSSAMPVSSDESIRPYCCGHELCWPERAVSSQACFRTSKELFDHNRIEHDDDDDVEKPFRCGLAGCTKSWKSLNGLQYHLQISTVHFRNALSSRFPAQTGVDGGVSSKDASGSTSSTPASGRTYVCPHPECYKVYKHLSGLRYHRKHGHPKQLPVQFEVVPPSLERHKAKRMLAKKATEQSS